MTLVKLHQLRPSSHSTLFQNPKYMTIFVSPMAGFMVPRHFVRDRCGSEQGPLVVITVDGISQNIIRRNFHEQ